MQTARHDFLESVGRTTPALKLVFLNHSGSTANMLTGISSIDFLAAKQETRNFINYCLDHPLVKEVTVLPRYRRTEIIVELNDRSELKFNLIHTMIRRAMNCLHRENIMKDAYVNEFGMLVAAPHHHFDYLVLVNQYAQHTMPDRYKNYFSAFDKTERTKIFRYIQPKYDLVLNMLDDLYRPSSSNQLKITIGLRREKQNKLFIMLYRVAEYILFNTFSYFTKKPLHLTPSSKRRFKSISQKAKRTAV